MDRETREKWLAAHTATCVSEATKDEYLFYLQQLVLAELDGFQCKECQRVFTYPHEDKREAARGYCAHCGDKACAEARATADHDEQIDHAYRNGMLSGEYQYEVSRRR